MVSGRKLNDNFINKFNNEFSFVINFVKKNQNVFFGIRNNAINLYVNGGCFFEINEKNSKYIASFNIKGYKNNVSKDIMNILKEINKKELDNQTIDKWKQILPELKNAVESYMIKHKVGNGEGTSREKILQQKLALSFNNNNTKYYNYDIEYNIEKLKDYYYNVDGTTDNKTHTSGRMDNMVIYIKDNKLKLYLLEVKEGMDAIKNTNYDSKSSKKIHDSFGNGVIGHTNLYMEIIDKIKKNEDYISKYNNVKINFKDHIFNEIINTMKFLKKFDLINNPNYKNIDYDKVVFDDVELVFYLGGYNMNSKKLEEHLGLRGNKIDSVINLINNNPMKYKYIDKNQIYDFKYYKDEKKYNSLEPLSSKDLNIEEYNQIVVSIKDNKVIFTEK